MTASEEARTRRNAAWPHAPHVLDRAKIDRRREEALSEVVALRDRIVTARAENLADAAAQLRRLPARPPPFPLWSLDLRVRKVEKEDLCEAQRRPSPY